MKLLSKTRDLIRQNEINVSKPQKHDTNLQKNSTLFFQVGLIVALLAAYLLLQLNFKHTETLVSQSSMVEEEDLYVMDLAYKIYKEPEPEPEPVVQKKNEPKLLLDPIISDNASDEPETKNLITEPLTTDKPMNPGDIKVIEPPVETPPIPVNLVEEVPVFPGCDKAKTKEKRMKCMSDKISKHIQKKFDVDLGSELGLSGIQRINVNFTINKKGEVVGIRAFSKHQELDKEAIDVMGKLPDMVPGKQNNKPVNVSYTFPIIFQVRD